MIMDKVESYLSFEGYIIECIDFAVNKSFKPESGQVELDFSLNCKFENKGDIFIVSLECFIFEDAENKNKPFSLTIVITGFFKFQVDLSEEKQRNMLTVNATAILYPYLRSIVTTITGNSGFPPLILPLINVSDFIKRNPPKEQSEK